MSNRHSLLDNPRDELHIEIKKGAKAMAKARMIMKGNAARSDDDRVMEEAALCVVLTNAVEVQNANGVAVGIAVYDTTFSWINHSCSPNACYYFSEFNDESGMLIAAASVDKGGYGVSVCASNGGMVIYFVFLGYFLLLSRSNK